MPKQSSTGKTRTGVRDAACGKRKRKAGRLKADGIPSGKEDISKYAELARQLVLAAWPEIVQGLIEKASSGGYQQAKLLFDVCNFNEPDISATSAAKRRELFDVLLESLEMTNTPADKNEPGRGASEPGKR